MPKRPGGRANGFTLVELLVVLALLALAGTLALPILTQPASDAALQTAARNLAAGMRVARAAAIRQGVTQTLLVDMAGRRFLVEGVTAPSTIPPGVAAEVVALQKNLALDSAARLLFFPDGSSTGGQVTLTSDRRTITVRLDWMTGHASVIGAR